MMKKKVFIELSLVLILLLTSFNILFFAIPFNRELSNDSFWIVYSFTIFMTLFTFTCYVTMFIKRNKSLIFFNYQLLKTTSIITLIQYALAIAILAIGNFYHIDYWIPLIVEILLTLFAVFFSLFLSLYKGYVKASNNNEKNNTSFIENLRAQTSALCSSNENEDLDNELNSLFEMIKYSDPIDYEKDDAFENDVFNKFDLLKKSVSNGDVSVSISLIKEIKKLLKQRKSSW